MATSPELKERQELPVKGKEEFAEVPESLREAGVTSVDAQRMPTPAVEHEGEPLVRPTERENIYRMGYTHEEVESMRKGGKISDSSRWLGTFLDRLAKLMKNVGRRVIYGRGTA